ncbi:MAG: RsmD family RNA methyltransferase [Gemmataceae bacterium]
MKTEIRIVAGSLRGRKLACNVHPDLRPTPQMVREAFFSILGNAIPDRPFFDVFSGTGVIGLEALSRGASSTIFVERDLQQSRDIEGHLKRFDLTSKGRVYRTDVYRWIANWQAPDEPVNIFVSPPFPDLHERSETFIEAVKTLMERVPEESVIVLQTERDSPVEDAEALLEWEIRRYGRNTLMIWQKESPEDANAADQGEEEQEANHE